MHPESPRWQAITESQFPWEREALELVRQRLPDHEPYRAWASFEVVADDGSVNEVDLMVLSPAGWFLVEIKSQPGGLTGDAGTWIWRHDGRDLTVDNPLILCNRKAKRLKSLLQRQPAARRTRLPFLEPLVFLSATDLHVGLERDVRQGVYGRDVEGEANTDALPGIVARLTGAVPGHGSHRGPRITSEQAQALERAMKTAGVRRSQRYRRVGDYLLEELLAEAEHWQDWRARHTGLAGVERRVRIYSIARGLPRAERERVERAAARELRLLEGVNHPGILKVLDYKKHELGPVLVFEHRPKEQRLDHYLRERGETLPVDTRLHLLRQIAEALAHAHDKRLVHRGLAPASVLILDPERPLPQPQLFNWQTGLRRAATRGATSAPAVSGTAHLAELVDEEAATYLAPELRHDPEADGVAADVFSLGALAFRLFAGRAPAATPVDLLPLLKKHDGLSLSAATDDAPESLDLLIAAATCPDATRRPGLGEILEMLDGVEEELTRPDETAVADPALAKAGDLLDGGYSVLHRLGQGSTSLVFLVEGTEGRRQVLKLARDASKSSLLDDEAEVLEKLRHSGVVEIHGTVQLYGRTGILMARAGKRTLAEKIREEGRLELELLERFGDDLLATVSWLEEQGIPHRDIKPDNLGIEASGPDEALHLVLFDFSLSRAPAEKIELGTRPYLDPFLPLRSSRRWDLAAERFAAAMTLYQMATGTLPAWGDGKSDPALLDAEVTLEAEAFAPALREPLSSFFRRSLARDAEERFDNADEMLKAWRRAFTAAAEPALPAAAGAVDEPLEHATPATQIIELGLSTRAYHALERLGVETVRELLSTPLGRLNRMRGVGRKTRGELVAAVRRLRERFPAAAAEPAPPPAAAADAEAREAEAAPHEPADLDLDALAARLLPARDRQPGRDRVLRLLLGLEAGEDLDPWPTQTAVAAALELTRARAHQLVAGARRRWSKIPALTPVRAQVADVLRAQGGVMTAVELAAALLAARGSEAAEATARCRATAVARAAVETEESLGEPRFRQHRRGGRVLLTLEGWDEAGQASGELLAGWAARLGQAADALAARDPLPSPAAVLEALEAVPPPEGFARLPASRLVRLAAAASRRAAVSGRLELYPRGMAARRALQLAAGSLFSLKAGSATPERLRQRVAARYPEAEPLPDRPALDDLLAAEGLDLRWDEEAKVYRAPVTPGTLSSTGTLSRVSHLPRPAPDSAALATEDFISRLERARRDGGYLLLVTSPRRLVRAAGALARRFDLAEASLEELLLAAMKAQARELGVDWQVVLAADAAPPTSRDGRNLRALVDRALPAVEAALLERGGATLVTYPGLLARYDRLGLLERLRRRLERPRPGSDGTATLWVLAPVDEQHDLPHLDGKAVPVVTRGEWARIPGGWLANDASGAGAATP